MFGYVARIATALVGALVIGSATDAAACGAYGGPCPAWSVVEIYSNADGSVQFLMLQSASINGKTGHLAGQTLVSSNGVTEKSLTFPTDMADVYEPVLVATRGFADFVFVKPDFVIPNGFLFVPDGSLRLRDEPWYIGDDVRYAALPLDGVNALYPDAWGDGYAFIDTAKAMNNAGQFYTMTATSLRRNFSGLWWASPAGSESGWAVAVEHQGDRIFAALATYDGVGRPVWFAMPDPTLYVPGPADDVWPNTTWQGSIYRMTGPPFDVAAFDPSKVTATPVGGGGFHFPRPDDADVGVLYWSIEGSGVYGPYKNITRDIFGPSAPVCGEGRWPGPAVNYQGFWWNPAESGWGLHLTHQGDAIVALWLTYDASGAATWFLMPTSKSNEGTYAGSIYRMTGPPHKAPSFDSPATATPVGNGTLKFADRDNASFAYAVTGTAGTKDITRFVFADPPTVCNG